MSAGTGGFSETPINTFVAYIADINFFVIKRSSSLA
jgi:hypothetical protein